MKNVRILFLLLVQFVPECFGEKPQVSFRRNLFLIEYAIDGKSAQPMEAYKILRSEPESQRMLDKSARLKLLSVGLLLTGAVIDGWQLTTDLRGGEVSLPIFALGITLGLSGIGAAYWSDQVEVGAVHVYNRAE